MTSFCCPVAYPIALPDPARLGCAGAILVRFLTLGRLGCRPDRKVWQTVGKLRHRHGIVMSVEPQERGYRVEDWTWEARRVRSSVKGG